MSYVVSRFLVGHDTTHACVFKMCKQYVELRDTRILLFLVMSSSTERRRTDRPRGILKRRAIPLYVCYACISDKSELVCVCSKRVHVVYRHISMRISIGLKLVYMPFFLVRVQGKRQRLDASTQLP